MLDKKFLTDLGISDDEIIKKIVVEHGTALNAEKNAAEQLRTQLAEANTQIESFKSMDIESVKQSADEWKAKYEKSEADRAAFEHRTKVGSLVKELKLKDSIYEDYLTDQLIEKQLKFDGDKLIGGDDVINSFKAEHPDAFAADKPQVDMGGGTDGTSLGGNDFAFNFTGIRPHETK